MRCFTDVLFLWWGLRWKETSFCSVSGYGREWECSAQRCNVPFVSTRYEISFKHFFFFFFAYYMVDNGIKCLNNKTVGAIAYVGWTGTLRRHDRRRSLQADIGRLKVAAQVVHSLSGGIDTPYFLHNKSTFLVLYCSHEHLSINYSDPYANSSSQTIPRLFWGGVWRVCGFPPRTSFP